MTNKPEVIPHNAHDSYLAGRAAYKRGALKSDNPAPSSHSEFYKPWESGWLDEQKDSWKAGTHNLADVRQKGKQQ